MLRFSGGNLRPSTPETTLNVTPDRPTPISTPAVSTNSQRRCRQRHRDEPERVQHGAGEHHLGRAEAVGESCRRTAASRPRRGSARRAPARTSRGPSPDRWTSAAGTGRSRGGCPWRATGSAAGDQDDGRGAPVGASCGCGCGNGHEMLQFGRDGCAALSAAARDPGAAIRPRPAWRSARRAWRARCARRPTPARVSSTGAARRRAAVPA